MNCLSLVINRVSIFAVLALACTLPVVSAQEKENSARDLYFLPMASYDYMRLNDHEVHSPAIGFGIMKGEQNTPFTEVGKRFFTVAMYQPVFFQNETASGYPRTFHQIDFIFDGRNERHQFLGIFKSASDKPLAGGLQTYQAGAGWGYEVIRRPGLSLILGAVLGVSDFGLDLPDGSPWPLLPLPLIRFGLDTRFLTISFDFLTGPNLSFTLGPRSRIRFTGDMRMDYYRSVEDLICEYTLWYRFFPPEHKMGDFAGIGVGFKNDSLDFAISGDRDKNLELQHTGIFAVLDLTVLKLTGTYILDSRLLVDGAQRDKWKMGFCLSVQTLYRF
jgi:hypothetical protein